ncbi:hypothetical protein [Bacteroides sp.]|uniref:hypothetical protein n=1 Tax=Bacteroides sp. TaxID=29523 RepID=UPI0026098064|nr:hypothetical protein [Bacteroides sp.]
MYRIYCDGCNKSRVVEQVPKEWLCPECEKAEAQRAKDLYRLKAESLIGSEIVAVFVDGDVLESIRVKKPDGTEVDIDISLEYDDWYDWTNPHVSVDIYEV